MKTGCQSFLERGRIPPPVDDETVERTIEYLPKVVADMVQFQRCTGCRPGEACGLRPMDIENKGNAIWIYRPPEYKTDHVENDEGRVIPIGVSGQMLLEPYLELADDAFCFSPRESELQRRKLATARRKTRPSDGNRVGSEPGFESASQAW